MTDTILSPFQRKVLDFFSVQKGWFSDRFYLTGGTALSEFYLRHRLSEDLDFFSEQEFSLLPLQRLIKQLQNVTPTIQNIEFREFMGIKTFFLSHEKGRLKIDFNYYPFPLLEKGVAFHRLRIDSALDIAVNKTQTILTQPRSRDFIDAYLACTSFGWKFPDLLSKARQKFDWYVDPLHVASRLLLVKELKDYPKMITKLSEKEWQEFFISEARKLKPRIFSTP